MRPDGSLSPSLSPSFHRNLFLRVFNRPNRHPLCLARLPGRSGPALPRNCHVESRLRRDLTLLRISVFYCQLRSPLKPAIRLGRVTESKDKNKKTAIISALLRQYFFVVRIFNEKRRLTSSDAKHVRHAVSHVLSLHFRYRAPRVVHARAILRVHPPMRANKQSRVSDSFCPQKE